MSGDICGVDSGSETAGSMCRFQGCCHCPGRLSAQTTPAPAAELPLPSPAHGVSPALCVPSPWLPNVLSSSLLCSWDFPFCILLVLYLSYWFDSRNY